MLMTCRLRLVRRRPRPLGHDSGSSRAWRGALVRQRPLHRRLVWRRRGLWRRHEIRHELTVIAAIRRLITVLSQRCTDVGVGVGPCYRVQPFLLPRRRRWHGPACTVHAVPRVMGRRGRTPICCAAAAKAEEAAAGVSDDVTTAGCSDFMAVSKLPLVHCLVPVSKYDTGSATGRKCQPPTGRASRFGMTILLMRTSGDLMS